MKERTKKLIIELHQSTGSVRSLEIEEEFPELFKEEALVVGKWYKYGSMDSLMVFNNGKNTYGFFNGKYGTNWYFSIGKTATLATDKEVEQALIKEAKKRGFKEGVVFNVTRDLWGVSKGGKTGYNTIINNNFEYSNSVRVNCTDCCMSIFTKGVWAEIIKETITKEQAEKELGKTIIN